MNVAPLAAHPVIDRVTTPTHQSSPASPASPRTSTTAPGATPEAKTASTSPSSPAALSKPSALGSGHDPPASLGSRIIAATGLLQQDRKMAGFSDLPDRRIPGFPELSGRQEALSPRRQIPKTATSSRGSCPFQQNRGCPIISLGKTGGGCSQRRTRLSHEFPGIREFCREFLGSRLCLAAKGLGIL
jgi:hypothetical protein